MTIRSYFSMDDNERFLMCSKRQDPQELYVFLASSDRDAKMGALSATTRRSLIIMPGTYTSLHLSVDYVDVREHVPGTVTFTDGITIGSGVDAVNYVGLVGGGYSITGNTLTVTSVGKPGDRFATGQASYDEVAVNDILGEPSATNNVWVEYSGINFEQGRAAVASVADVDGTDSAITTSTAHGLTAGDYVRLVGMSVAAYDSDFATAYEVLTVPTDTTFTIEMTYSATATGVAIKQGVLTTSNSYVGIKVPGTTNLVIL